MESEVELQITEDEEEEPETGRETRKEPWKEPMGRTEVPEMERKVEPERKPRMTVPRKQEQPQREERREPQRKETTVGKRFTKPLLWTAGMLLVIVITVWAVQGQGMNRIQAGGIFFVGIGVLIYLLSVRQRKPVKSKERLEEVIEEWKISSDGEETVLFGKELRESYPVLVSMEPDRQENIVLNKEVMRVGKQKDQVDIYLSDTMISRIHAGFEREDDEWYIVDYHSTNGTFLNGERITPGERNLLKEGMEIRLAAQGFYFHGINNTASKD